jgi:hypothetical protein
MTGWEQVDQHSAITSIVAGGGGVYSLQSNGTIRGFVEVIG